MTYPSVGPHKSLSRLDTLQIASTVAYRSNAFGASRIESYVYSLSLNINDNRNWSLQNRRIFGLIGILIHALHIQQELNHWSLFKNGGKQRLKSAYLLRYHSASRFCLGFIQIGIEELIKLLEIPKRNMWVISKKMTCDRPMPHTL